LLQIGESGKSTRELEKTVGLLKKVVERVQTENEVLKKTAAGEANIRIQTMQIENDGLKVGIICFLAFSIT
jgi:centrosomal protein CEP290